MSGLLRNYEEIFPDGYGISRRSYNGPITKDGAERRPQGFAMVEDSSSDKLGDASSEKKGSPFKRKRSGGSLASMSTVLSQVLGKYGLEQRMKEHAFMDLWQDIVDEPFKKVSRPLFIDYEGNLVISVQDAIVAQELSFHRGQLMKKLAPFARGVGLRINGIRFDLKHFKEAEDSEMFTLSRRQAEARLSVTATEAELAQVELPDHDLNELAKLKAKLDLGALDGDHDPATTDRIVRMYERELRRKAWRETKGFDACSQCGYVDSRMYGVTNLCRMCHVVDLITYRGTVNKVQD
jgi:hypothetical protein